jgi:hypothetical protein
MPDAIRFRSEAQFETGFAVFYFALKFFCSNNKNLKCFDILYQKIPCYHLHPGLFLFSNMTLISVSILSKFILTMSNMNVAYKKRVLL